MLDYLGVSLESLSIAGGLLLSLVALEMLRGIDAAPDEEGDVALVPLVALGASLLLAERLARLVSPALLHFLTRVFGLLLAAIAVQLVVDGVRPLVEGG